MMLGAAVVQPARLVMIENNIDRPGLRRSVDVARLACAGIRTRIRNEASCRMEVEVGRLRRQLV